MEESLVERHIRFLRCAELQFLLAYKVNPCTIESLRLHQLVGWTYGQHTMSREELTLSVDDASLATALLHHSATLSLAVHIVTAYEKVVDDVRSSTDSAGPPAFEIAKLIRNAYAHSPADPHWLFDRRDKNKQKQYEVPGIISLDTTNLKGEPLTRDDYGGPIAMYRLSEFVRTRVLPQYEN